MAKLVFRVINGITNGPPFGLIKTNYTISDEKTSSMDAAVVFFSIDRGHGHWFGLKTKCTWLTRHF